MMNALKFLAVDRSLDSGKDFVGRFRMREFGMLPELTEKRSVAVESESAAVAERPTSRQSMWRRLVGWVGRTGPMTANPKTGSVEKKRERQLFRQTTPEQLEPAAGPSGVKVEGGRRFALFASCNPFGRTEKKVVQAEFRFEHVRVVCNELHDTDFIIKT